MGFLDELNEAGNKQRELERQQAQKQIDAKKAEEERKNEEIKRADEERSRKITSGELVNENEEYIKAKIIAREKENDYKLEECAKTCCGYITYDIKHADKLNWRLRLTFADKYPHENPNSYDNSGTYFGKAPKFCDSKHLPNASSEDTQAPLVLFSREECQLIMKQLSVAFDSLKFRYQICDFSKNKGSQNERYAIGYRLTWINWDVTKDLSEDAINEIRRVCEDYVGQGIKGFADPHKHLELLSEFRINDVADAFVLFPNQEKKRLF